MPEKLVVYARCFERAVIALSGAFLCYVGYRLYALGVSRGDVQMSWDQLIVKGTGPGLLFMVCGVGLLMCLLRTPIRIARSKDGDDERLEVQGVVEPPPE